MSKLNTSILAFVILFPLLAAHVDASARPIQGAFLDTSSQAIGFDDEKPPQGEEAAVIAIGDSCEAVLLVANEFDKNEVQRDQEPVVVVINEDPCDAQLVATKFDKELHDQGEEEAVLVGVVIKYFMLDEKIVTFTRTSSQSHPPPHSEKQQTMKLFALSISFSASNKLYKYFAFVKDFMYICEQVSKWFSFVF